MEEMKTILARREARSKLRQELHDEFDWPVVVFTLNIPGADKNRREYVPVHKTGEAQLLQRFSDLDIEVLRSCVVYGVCGREVLLVARGSAERIKEICWQIEEEHPLGRLYDMDVYDTEGRSIDRAAIGRDQRRCFICDSPAAECARSQAHSRAELSQYIEARVLQFYEAQKPQKVRS